MLVNCANLIWAVKREIVVYFVRLFSNNPLPISVFISRSSHAAFTLTTTIVDYGDFILMQNLIQVNLYYAARIVHFIWTFKSFLLTIFLCNDRKCSLSSWLGSRRLGTSCCHARAIISDAWKPKQWLLWHWSAARIEVAYLAGLLHGLARIETILWLQRHLDWMVALEKEFGTLHQMPGMHTKPERKRFQVEIVEGKTAARIPLNSEPPLVTMERFGPHRELALYSFPAVTMKRTLISWSCTPSTFGITGTADSLTNQNAMHVADHLRAGCSLWVNYTKISIKRSHVRYVGFKDFLLPLHGTSFCCFM